MNSPEGPKPPPPTAMPTRAPARAKPGRSFLLKRRAPTLQLRVVRLELNSLDITESMQISSSVDGWPGDDALVDVIAAANMPIVQPMAPTGLHKVVCNAATVSWLRGLDPSVIGYPPIINWSILVEQQLLCRIDLHSQVFNTPRNDVLLSLALCTRLSARIFDPYPVVSFLDSRPVQGFFEA